MSMTSAFSLCHLAQDGNLADVLPFNILRHVVMLDLQHPYDFWDRYHAFPDWPMAWSQLTALECLSCMLSNWDDNYPPPMLNSMTNLEMLHITHRHPEVDDEVVHEMYGGDYELAERVEILEKVFMGTRGLSQS